MEETLYSNSQRNMNQKDMDKMLLPDLYKLEETHTLKNFSVSKTDLTKDGVAFEIDLLYSYDLRKQLNKQSNSNDQNNKLIIKEFITDIPKIKWKNWVKVKYSDDFVEQRVEEGGCISMC
ncbi:hypothetical protein M153_795000516 [Pseudoloma neurophilia]|uniref:Uncharacterized protein n=1 Tax=Pseudoloma neurophilia TaxID=146866 RepID=A0A0R0M1N7_9MICR|nr:hypothetical protein M153_795000516 [Pseudoloma neurophilia]